MPVPTEINTSAEAIAEAHSTGAVSTSALAAALQPGRADEIGSTFRLPVRPNNRFFLAHHPGDWEPDVVKGKVADVELDGVYWLPNVAPRSLQPGAALIRTRQKLEPIEAMYQHARDVSQRDGWVWLDPLRNIPAECLPPGVPAGGYWREVPCIDPVTRETGMFNLEVWNLPTETLPGRPQRFAYERKSYNLWRAWLLLTGQVKPPLDYVIEGLRHRMRDRIERARTLPLPDGALQRKVREAEERATIYVDAVIPTAAAASAPKRGSK